MENILSIIQSFLISDALYTWIENHLFYFFLVGVVVAFILILILMIKTRREIKRLDKRKRKRDKQLLKFLSNRKNKTY